MPVYCFDFDGVICDSAPETALSAWNACRRLWPGPAALSPETQQRFGRLRPVLHTGWEAMPIMRLIEEGRHDDEVILADFPTLRDELIAREGLERADLQQRFSQARDALIEQDPRGWLASNPFFPGMRELLAAAIAAGPTTIITTKQERFVDLLLGHNGIRLPMERVYGLERNQPKPDLLTALVARPGHAGEAFHFVEDRFETLQDVIARPALHAVRLFLADWGYNTPPQRARAAATGRIAVVDMAGLRRGLGL